MIQISDQCRNKWASILPALGVRAEFLTGKHGPCPACGGKDRFRFDDKDGRGTFICQACGAGDGFKLLQLVSGLSFRDAAAEIRPLLGEIDPSAPKPGRDRSGDEAASRRLWERGRPITATDDAGRYLASRGLHPPYPADLRLVRDCALTGHPTLSALPAMVALVRRPEGSPVIVHRTYLQDGAKAPIESPRRMMAGTVPKGSAIRLARHSGVLGVAEGIETAMWAMRRFQVPCWSAVDADKLAAFQWPPDVRALHVFGDHDRNFAGHAAAYRLAYRASTAREPLEVHVHIPDVSGTDWADAQE